MKIRKTVSKLYVKLAVNLGLTVKYKKTLLLFNNYFLLFFPIILDRFYKF